MRKVDFTHVSSLHAGILLRTYHTPGLVTREQRSILRLPVMAMSPQKCCLIQTVLITHKYANCQTRRMHRCPPFFCCFLFSKTYFPIVSMGHGNVVAFPEFFVSALHRHRHHTCSVADKQSINHLLSCQPREKWMDLSETVERFETMCFLVIFR
jgi:hypothetical protein